MTQSDRDVRLGRIIDRLLTVMKDLRKETAGNPPYVCDWARSAVTALEGIVGTYYAQSSAIASFAAEHGKVMGLLDKIDAIASTLHIEGARASARELRQDAQRIRKDSGHVPDKPETV